MSPTDPKRAFGSLRLIFFIFLAVLVAFLWRSFNTQLNPSFSPNLRFSFASQKFTEKATAFINRLIVDTQQRTQEFIDDLEVRQKNGDPENDLHSKSGQTINLKLSRISLNQPWKEIKVCSFNIRIFSNKSRNDQELETIAKILKYYDLIAIQELKDEDVLKRTVTILKRMGYRYDYVISPPVGKIIKERYAFLFRPEKISLKDQGKVYLDKNDEFLREPFYAEFQAGHFDFLLVNIHVIYGDNENLRRKEIFSLAKVYRTLQKENPKEKDIILLGDFNLSPEDEGFKEFKFFEAMRYLIISPDKTTITDTNLYDNFWFQQNFVKEYTGQSGVIRFDENIFQNNDRKAKLAVSDHRPIWADFKIDMEDDD